MKDKPLYYLHTHYSLINPKKSELTRLINLNVFVNHYTDYNPERLRLIYEEANLKVLS